MRRDLLKSIVQQTVERRGENEYEERQAELHHKGLVASNLQALRDSKFPDEVAYFRQLLYELGLTPAEEEEVEGVLSEKRDLHIWPGAEVKEGPPAAREHNSQEEHRRKKVEATIKAKDQSAFPDEAAYFQGALRKLGVTPAEEAEVREAMRKKHPHRPR